MLAAVDAKFYEPPHDADVDGGTWLRREAEHFGVDHATIGQIILSRWGASEDLAMSVLTHHEAPFVVEPRNNGQWGPAGLAGFFASLLPHLDEPLTTWQREWLDALHMRFLFPDPALFEPFLRDLRAEFEATNPNAAKAAVDEDRLTGDLMQSLGTDVCSMAAKLHSLEQQLQDQTLGINTVRTEAVTDPLTKLLNRRGFFRLSRQRLMGAASGHSGACAILLDLDDFKEVNDTLGHKAGDRLLRGIAKLMRSQLMPTRDLLARLGGDEFVILMTEVSEAESAQRAHELERAIKRTRIRIDEDTDLHLSCSIGAAFHQHSGDEEAIDIDDLLAVADKAMYRQKRAGKAGTVFVTTAELKTDGGDLARPSRARKQMREDGPDDIGTMGAA